MKKIPLTRGYVALVSDEDYEGLVVHKWRAHVGRYTVYAVREVRVDGRSVQMGMHQVLAGKDADHINRIGWDNQRHNLRSATRSEQMCNRRKPSNNTSGVKGVCWHSKSGKWQAVLGLRGKKIYLGLFDSVPEASAAVHTARETLHGEFACHE